MASPAPCFPSLTWVTPPMAQVSMQQPHRHYIYKYVAGANKSGVLSGNNIRPFKYIYMGGVAYVHYVGAWDVFIDTVQIKKKRIV